MDQNSYCLDIIFFFFFSPKNSLRYQSSVLWLHQLLDLALVLKQLQLLLLWPCSPWLSGRDGRMVVYFLLFLAGFGDTPTHESLLLKCQTYAKPSFRLWLCSFEGWYKKRSYLYQSLSNPLSRPSYDQTLRACWSSHSSYRQTQKHLDYRTLVFLPLDTTTCSPAPCIYSCLLCFGSAFTKTLQCSLDWCFSILLKKEECQDFSAHSKSSLHLTISSVAEIIHHPEK